MQIGHIANECFKSMSINSSLTITQTKSDNADVNEVKAYQGANSTEARITDLHVANHDKDVKKIQQKILIFHIMDFKTKLSA